MPYARITDADLARFEAIVGADHVLTRERGDPAQFERYSRDETEDLQFWPDAAARPGSTDEVAALLAHCHERRIAVTPWAAGTGLSGGALPVLGGLSISLQRLDQILDIDLDNGFAVVQAGCILQTLQESVAEHGWYYPPDPSSRGSCTIGGNIAENAGGPRCVKYGLTKDYVFGLEVVLADGRVCRFGGKRYKDVAGYNMAQVFVGSEGTLGIVTEATLKLVPQPTHRRTLLAPFESVDAAAATVAALFQRRIVPAACEYMERAAIEAAVAHLGKDWPHSDAPAQLLLEVDGMVEAVVEAEAMAVGETCVELGARDVLLAESAAQQDDLWNLRRATGEAVKRLSIYKEEDCVVPRARLPELVRAVHGVAERWGLRIISYGHAGDGNLHCNILKDDHTDEFWRDELPQAIEELFREVVALGGTITGEHGVGYVQRRYLGIAQSPDELAAQWAIKRALDPHLILNPAKIFPDDFAAQD